MKVWIDQDLCTGDGQCVEICPEMFFMHDDDATYRSYVRRVGDSGRGSDGVPTLRMGQGRVDVPRQLRDAVVEAADFCPGECIFIERPDGRDRSGPGPDPSHGLWAEDLGCFPRTLTETY